MAESTRRQMALVGFMQAGNATVYAGSWRHPATEHGFLTAGYYEKLARTLEEGCFDLMFFDDRLAMPGIYGGSVAEAVRTGARPVKLDLSIVLGICAAVTSRIGLGATYSTTYYTPFHVARTFATLDHLSGGRAAWNVVTSVNDSEAQNYGLKEVLAPRRPLRPRRRVPRGDHRVVGQLGRRRAGARPRDAALRRPAQGARAQPRRASGSRCAVRSPCPRCPQGRPVLLQAGSSGRGREFAARWAELIFTGDPGIDIARVALQGPEGEDRRAGPRTPTSVKMLPMAYTVVGESKAHAEEREQMFLNDLVDPMASLTLLSELMNYDFSGLDARRAHHRRADRVGVGHPRPGPEHQDPHRRRDRDAGATWPGTGPPCCRALASSGTGTDIADQMEEWFGGGACDGFVIAATHSPGAYEDVVRLVVPELQRRGLFRDALHRHDAARASRARAPGVVAPVPERTGLPLAGHPGHRRRHAGGRADGGHGARRVRRRGDQGGAARRRATPCGPGASRRTASACSGRA